VITKFTFKQLGFGSITLYIDDASGGAWTIRGDLLFQSHAHELSVTISAQRPKIEDAAIFLPFGDNTESNFLLLLDVVIYNRWGNRT